MAEFPETIADYIAGLTDEDFINGGHRTNFIPTGQGAAVLAQYVEAKSVEFHEYAETVKARVAADAEAAAAGSGTEASVAAIRASADVAHYVSMRNVTAANVPVVLADAPSIAWDMSTGINFSITLTAAGRALANPTAMVAGKSGFINVFQDGVGARSITAWGNAYRWIGNRPVFPLAPNARTKIGYFVNSAADIELVFAGNSE